MLLSQLLSQISLALRRMENLTDYRMVNHEFIQIMLLPIAPKPLSDYFNVFYGKA